MVNELRYVVGQVLLTQSGRPVGQQISCVKGPGPVEAIISASRYARAVQPGHFHHTHAVYVAESSACQPSNCDCTTCPERRAARAAVAEHLLLRAGRIRASA